MVTVENLKKEVNDIKAQVNPEPKHYIINMGFSSDNQPHGFLCGSLYHIKIGKDGKETRWHQPIDSQTELASHKAYYDELLSSPHNKFMKQPEHPFHSFESFLDYSRCKCGRHGPNNNEPYLGELSL